MRKFEVDGALLVSDIGTTQPLLDEVLNDPKRDNYDLVDILPIPGTHKVKVVWRQQAIAEEKK